ncbi:endonuclease III [Patescibacteria group bacterium]|nr:endonuclease III [Patescibacteria group bacterium]MBU1952693.1 endonuclease III [Patescibacteria group bacterium]
MENLNEKAEEIARILEKNYPNPKTELVHANEYELAVSVVLSAQTTDKKVNQVTPALFKEYPTWQVLSNAEVADVANFIRQVNFYKGKAQRLVKAAQRVVAEYEGVLPHSMESLMTIPGIARKSANVIMQQAWGIAEGIVVDTHVIRVSNKLGLTIHKDPAKIERDLMNIFPRKYWRNISSALVLHGRYICIARKPNCGECCLNKICPSAFK